ncbi:hypothetical protein [Nostoc punctiforme]|nr:hypothetical protein [Nostoc punctiforme]
MVIKVLLSYKGLMYYSKALSLIRFLLLFAIAYGWRVRHRAC